MPDPLWGGKLSDFAASMAREIEIALDEARTEAGLPPLPDPGSDATAIQERNDRRTLFIAIARGVLRHVQKHQDAIDVTVKVGKFPEVLVHPVIHVKAP